MFLNTPWTRVANKIFNKGQHLPQWLGTNTSKIRVSLATSTSIKDNEDFTFTLEVNNFFFNNEGIDDNGLNHNVQQRRSTANGGGQELAMEWNFPGFG